jgi:hypothetical protein
LKKKSRYCQGTSSLTPLWLIARIARRGDEVVVNATATWAIFVVAVVAVVAVIAVVGLGMNWRYRLTRGDQHVALPDATTDMTRRLTLLLPSFWWLSRWLQTCKFPDKP